jgi:Helix-turn-helix domain
MRDKLLFTEAMMASGELTGRELRVGFLLVSMWSSNRGFSYPSMQYIADALNLDKRNVGKALDALEAKSWFLIGHGSRGRGRNHVNHYIPNVEKVSSATPFFDAVRQAQQKRDEREKVSIKPGKGVKTSGKGVTDDTRTDASLTGELRSEPFGASHRRTPDGARHGSAAPDDVFIDPRKAMAGLQRTERWLKYLKSEPDRPLTKHEQEIVQQCYDVCVEIAELYDSHTGDPIGGMAYRLCQDLYPYLPADEDQTPDTPPQPARPREMTAEEFEARRAQMIRELEGCPAER